MIRARDLLFGPALILLVCVVAGVALGHDGEWFGSLYTAQGASCCNEKDCEYTSSWDFKGGQYVVYKAGKAHPVPAEALVQKFTKKNPQPSKATVCWLNEETIRCFVPGVMA